MLIHHIVQSQSAGADFTSETVYANEAFRSNDRVMFYIKLAVAPATLEVNVLFQGRPDDNASWQTLKTYTSATSGWYDLQGSGLITTNMQNNVVPLPQMRVDIMQETGSVNVINCWIVE